MEKPYFFSYVNSTPCMVVIESDRLIIRAINGEPSIILQDAYNRAGDGQRDRLRWEADRELLRINGEVV